ncbi:hypothetical protein [Rhizobium rhizogenes]|uniref:hypothetical protein n=1 Tax=Rhizobium rhizogenes TaxID=359 RepID=UPI00157410C9|nr:hypothetical protein [Rhizobium rhizogenes]NTG08835.1 hypothetical protein [Rhizobium rhizogenes]
MQNVDTNIDLSILKSALERWRDSTITGGQVAALMRSVVPDLDVRAVIDRPKGKGALSEFIQNFLSDALERVGHQGADVLYQIKSSETPTAPAPASPEIWRTFVSPNSPRFLVLKPSIGHLSSRSTPALPAEGEIEVQKATPEEHDGIRADFTAGLPPKDAAALKEHVSDDSDFDSWISALKSHFHEATSQWGHYRRKRLAELLTSRIHSLQLGEPTRQTILEQVKSSELAAYEASKSRVRPEKHAGKQSQRRLEAVDTASRARQLAHAAVDHLTYEELRELRLPLGAMLDAIHQGS